MRIINAKEFLEMGTVIYSELDIQKGEIGEVYIKYNNNLTDKYTYEDFPIRIPDYEDCSTYIDNFDKFIRNSKKHQLVSDLETYGDFLDGDEMFVIYSKQDVESWINKLNEVIVDLEDE